MSAPFDTALEAMATEVAAGLNGWKVIAKPLDETTDWAAVMTSPDYDPTAKPPAGRLFAARGATREEALANVGAKVRAVQ